MTICDTSWMAEAACAPTTLGQNRTNEFFPSTGLGVLLAREVCRHCSVQVECLRYALDNHIADGVWGGWSEQQRTQYWSRRAQEAREQNRRMRSDQ